MERDNWTCQLCLHRNYPLEIDHILPIKKGEIYDYDVNDPNNYWTLCSMCNQGKGAK